MFASSGCMQTIIEFLPYEEIWKLNALNKRFYNQILPQTMTTSGINPRIMNYIHLYDGKDYKFSISRMHLESNFAFRIEDWPDKDTFFENLRLHEDIIIEIGELEPCSGTIYTGWTVKEGDKKYRHGFGR